ncbi:MAG: hypothetical protein Q4A00_07705 [Flavobacteriaceae bacterium]|nr:hypothetical protein [Flavobacteriaceae bacterium]
MIYTKGSVFYSPDSITLTAPNNSSNEQTVVFSFEDLKEPVFVSRRLIGAFVKHKVVLLNGLGKSVVLEDYSKTSFALNAGVLDSYFGSYSYFLLTKDMKIIVETPVNVMPHFVLNVYRGSFFDLKLGLQLSRCFDIAPNEKRILSVKDFDSIRFLARVSSLNSEVAEFLVNGETYKADNDKGTLYSGDTSFVEIHNTSGKQLFVWLLKEVFNTETFLSYQYLLDLKILRLSILLRNDFHNTMSKIYFGELPDIEKLQSERQLLLRSDFNEANKGYYDDYEYSVSSDEELQGALPLPT